MRRWYESTPRTTIALISAAVALIVGGYMILNRGLREHDIVVSSPSPPGVFVDGRLPLEGGDLACVGPIRFTPAAGKIRLVLETQASPVPPLRITARANTTKNTTIVSDYVSGKITDVQVPFTVSQAVGGSVCVRNIGTSQVSLASTDEARYASLTRTELNGKPSKMQASLQLLTAKRSTIFNRLPTAVRQDSQLTGVLPRVLVWLLLAGVLVAIVAGPLFVMADTLRRDDENSG